MLTLYIALVRSKLEYASVVWNSITSTDANKLEHIQQRLLKSLFFPRVHYCYALALEELKLQTLRMRRHRLDSLFLTQVYSALPLWKLLVAEFLLGMSENLYCSMSPLQVKVVPLLIYCIITYMYTVLCLQLALRLLTQHVIKRN
jgi:hypothetical protein